MKNGMPNQPGMNRPPGMMTSTGSVPSPIQPHHSPMAPQLGIPPRGPPMMGSMGPQQMGGPGGMPPGMVQMMQQQQPPPMMGQHPQMSMPQQQQAPQPSMMAMAPQQPSLPPQIFNKQYMCRVGADVVQEIISKALELFQLLRSMILTLSSSNHEEKKNKIKESCKYIESLFKRLRKIYEACNEACSSIDYIDPKSLIHLKDDDDNDSEEEKDKIKDDIDDGPDTAMSSTSSIIPDEKKSNAKLQQLEKEYNDLVELNKLKNRQLKEIIDRIRKLIWDINTMLAMRRP